MELGEAQMFSYFNQNENTLTVDSERMTEDDIGVYKLKIKASEVRSGQTYEYERSFYLQIKPKSAAKIETNSDLTETFGKDSN